ncbi:uncharacterized protein J8A68_004408, partial [[Candida] subhashii]
TNVPAGFVPFAEVFMDVRNGVQNRVRYLDQYQCVGSYYVTNNSQDILWSPYKNDSPGGNGQQVVVVTQTYTGSTTQLTTMPIDTGIGTITIVVQVPIPTVTTTSTRNGPHTTITVTAPPGETASVIDLIPEETPTSSSVESTELPSSTEDQDSSTITDESTNFSSSTEESSSIESSTSETEQSSSTVTTEQSSTSEEEESSSIESSTSETEQSSSTVTTEQSSTSEEEESSSIESSTSETEQSSSTVTTEQSSTSEEEESSSIESPTSETEQPSSIVTTEESSTSEEEESSSSESSTSESEQSSSIVTTEESSTSEEEESSSIEPSTSETQQSSSIVTTEQSSTSEGEESSMESTTSETEQSSSIATTEESSTSEKEESSSREESDQSSTTSKEESSASEGNGESSSEGFTETSTEPSTSHESQTSPDISTEPSSSQSEHQSIRGMSSTGVPSSNMSTSSSLARLSDISSTALESSHKTESSETESTSCPTCTSSAESPHSLPQSSLNESSNILSISAGSPLVTSTDQLPNSPDSHTYMLSSRIAEGYTSVTVVVLPSAYCPTCTIPIPPFVNSSIPVTSTTLKTSSSLLTSREISQVETDRRTKHSNSCASCSHEYSSCLTCNQESHGSTKDFNTEVIDTRIIAVETTTFPEPNSGEIPNNLKTKTVTLLGTITEYHTIPKSRTAIGEFHRSTILGGSSNEALGSSIDASHSEKSVSSKPSESTIVPVITYDGSASKYRHFAVWSEVTMIVIRKPANNSCRLILQRRYLFKGLKNVTTGLQIYRKKDDNEGFHHEYSIRPDTYAFKVSGSNDSLRSITSKPKKVAFPDLGAPHPLQQQDDNSNPGFNAIEYIYRKSTNYPFGNKTPQQVFDSYPLTNSDKLARLTNRPTRVKMSTSDFIEDSLYNPNYGYFSKEVEIYQPDTPFDYKNIKDIDQFIDNWQKSYSKYDQKDHQSQQQQQQQSAPPQLLEQKSSGSKLANRALQIHKMDLEATKGQIQTTKKSLQLWHTPTELFQPHYGEALARYILVNYKLNGNYPYEDLIIYEMGGGNGTLMCNILNYIRKNQPDIYARTKYKIIEISSQLAAKQMKQALNNKLASHGLDSSKLEIYNKSIFKWDKVVTEPCFFIALEVFDNFAHDLIRYDNLTGQPFEGKVLIDEHGDFYEFFTPELSYYSNAYLNLRESGSLSILDESNSIRGKMETIKSVIPFLTDKDKIHPLLHSSTKLKMKNSILPFKDNLTPGEFIPTRLLHFFHILKHRFPNHSLLCSDFNYLPKTIPGVYNGPVVQTVLKDRTVDVTTYMVHQGFFDIMFATDFNIASELYKQVTGKVPRVESHREFLDQWADTEATTTKTGENPMLDFYRNVSFMVS